MSRSSEILAEVHRAMAPGTDWPGYGYWSDWHCPNHIHSEGHMSGGIIGHPGATCPLCGSALIEEKGTRRMPLSLVETRESLFRAQIAALSAEIDGV